MSATTVHPLLSPERESFSRARPFTIHRLLPVAVLYFFFNSTGLPYGLFYSSILAPVFYIWLNMQGRRWLTLKFLLLLSPFVVAHALQGVDSWFYYARSALLLWTVYIATYTFCLALTRDGRPQRLFDELIVLNFAAALLAVLLLPTALGDPLWNANFHDLDYLPGYARRLQLFTLEPSHYGFEMLPLLLYAALRFIQSPGTRHAFYLAMILLPLLLSQSFGSLLLSAVSLAVALLPALPRLMKRGSSILIFAAIALLVAGILLTPNPLSLRAAQVSTGADSSVNSRTVNGLAVAYFIASSRSVWWGAGLGQAKLQDVFDLKLGFATGVIPNALGATFAELGLVAILIKLLLEIYLFFRTRVYANTFRLAMFSVAFLSQMTGGNLMNVQEYLTWFFAFVTFFPELQLARSAAGRAPR